VFYVFSRKTLFIPVLIISTKIVNNYVHNLLLTIYYQLFYPESVIDRSDDFSRKMGHQNIPDFFGYLKTLIYRQAGTPNPNRFSTSCGTVHLGRFIPLHGADLCAQYAVRAFEKEETKILMNGVLQRRQKILVQLQEFLGNGDRVIAE